MLKYLLAGAVALTAGLAATAQSPIPVYVDREELFAEGAGRPDTSELDARVADIVARSERLYQDQAELEQRQLVSAPETIRDMQDDIARRADAIATDQRQTQRDFQQLFERHRIEFGYRIDAAIGTFLSTSPGVAVYLDETGSGEDGLIVLNPEYDMTAATLQMLTSGAETIPFAVPSRPPVVKFVWFSTFTASTNILEDDIATLNSVVDKAQADLEALQGQWQQQIIRLESPALGPEAKREANVAITEIERQMQQRRAEADTQLRELNALARYSAFLELAAFIPRTDATSGVDIVIIIPESQSASSPVAMSADLDLTEAIVTAWNAEQQE